MMDHNGNRGTMTLPTHSAIAIWHAEITGQISDGMWENSTPHNHYQFWFTLDTVLGDVPKVKSDAYCMKRNYNLRRLLNIGEGKADPDYCIRDRMVQKGRMGLALASCGVSAEIDCGSAAEYMPATYAEWTASKASGVWVYDFVGKYMEVITDEIAQAYYQRMGTYGIKEMKQDLELIKAAMVTA